MHLTKAITFELQDKLWTLLKVLEAFKVIKELRYYGQIIHYFFLNRFVAKTLWMPKSMIVTNQE